MKVSQKEKMPKVMLKIFDMILDLIQFETPATAEEFSALKSKLILKKQEILHDFSRKAVDFGAYPIDFCLPRRKNDRRRTEWQKACEAEE